jgi:hypothetical protein
MVPDIRRAIDVSGSQHAIGPYFDQALQSRDHAQNGIIDQRDLQLKLAA